MTEKKPLPRPTGRRTTRARATQKKQATFLRAMRKGASQSAASAAAGVSRRTPYKWRDDPTFAAAWDDAESEGTDRIEDAVYRRAVQGTRRPVYQQGKKVGEVTEYSDHMAAILLKARRPEKYRERGPEVSVNVAPALDLRETARRLAVLFRRVKSEMQAEELRARLLPEKLVNPTDT